MSQSNRKPPSQSQILPGFPTLGLPELLQCLSALGIPAQMEDLTKPTPGTTQGIYAGLIEALMGAPVESIEAPKKALLGMMEYKEMYGDALQFTMFFRHVRDLANLCGITNFSLADITRPEAARFRTVLSGIMNFAKFRDERAHFQAHLQARLQEQAEKTVSLRQKIDQVENDISEITARNAAERPQSEQAQKRNDGLRAELLELRSQQIKLSGEVEELKKERQGLMDQAAHNAHLNTQIQHQILSTKSRLVQSPDRIKKQITEMTLSLSSEKARLSSFQLKARELSNRLEVITSLELDLKNLIDLQKTIEGQKSKIEESKRAKTSWVSKKESKEMELKNLQSRSDQLQRQIENAQNKLDRQQELTNEIREKHNKRLEDLKAEYKVRTKERGGWQKQRDLLLAEQKELENEMANFIQTHENEINDLLQEYWTMRRQAEDYMNTMTIKLGLQVRA
ncbi:hypothetical protein I302_102862 [Kwoniella bestiolae CBS 10118]|uniref:Kinetochore protein Nuf2 n=1 Tax=Kwoniella bestiolae CBS 10118 TaxID=1296100 RepID=A0A1B9GG75_9TREE|nr:kinetochore protein Nuf2 [Kwoniella bestiolae CBS 10118]OCF30039.1 kinetochore protein Nuf2 [Kwoniella bestiolae CBS 10118]